MRSTIAEKDQEIAIMTEIGSVSRIQKMTIDESGTHGPGTEGRTATMTRTVKDVTESQVVAMTRAWSVMVVTATKAETNATVTAIDANGTDVAQLLMTKGVQGRDRSALHCRIAPARLAAGAMRAVILEDGRGNSPVRSLTTRPDTDFPLMAIVALSHGHWIYKDRIR